MVVISYRERKLQIPFGGKPLRTNRNYIEEAVVAWCVSRVRLTLLTGKTFSRGNDDLFQKKKRKETPRYLWSNSEKFLSNVGERINYFSRVWRERRTEVTDGIAYRVCISAVSNRKKNLYTPRLRCFERTRTKLKIRYLFARSSGRGKLRGWKTRGSRVLLDYVW